MEGIDHLICLARATGRVEVADWDLKQGMLRRITPDINVHARTAA